MSDLVKMTSCESGTQLLARLESRLPLEGVVPQLFNNGPKLGDVIEFVGDEGKGKTELLLHCIIRSILPESWRSFKLNGIGTKIIYIDTTYKFNILRLVILLEKYILSVTSSTQGEENIDKDIESFIAECLKNVYIIQCSSSQQLLCTLHYLEIFLSGNSDVSCLMIDSISAFYWQDRATIGAMTQTFEKHMERIIQLLENISKKYNIIVMVTKEAIFKYRTSVLPKEENVPGMHSAMNCSHMNTSDFLGKSWNKFVSEKFTLKSNAVDINNKVIFNALSKSSGMLVKYCIEESGVIFI